MYKTLKIDLDNDVLLGLNKTPEEMASEIRILAAVKWYELGQLSQEKAAQIAGVSRSEFIQILSRYEVSPMQETAEEIIEAIRSTSNC